VKQNLTRLALPQNLGFRFWLHAAAIKEGKRLTVKQKNLSTAFFLWPRPHFVGVHLFDFRFVGYTHRPRESDDLRFEFLLGFVLGHEFQDTFMNEGSQRSSR
jgi:hypothetical protein